ncbi:MAG: hypothetical protein U1E45_22615 [Geminicoccaceae bacterium]
MTFLGSALAAVLASALLLLLGRESPELALAGWLIGFVFTAAIAIGSLVLVLIHALTGGRWLDGLRAPLGRAVASVPGLLIVFVPIGLYLKFLYPWNHPGADVSPDVARYYLNNFSFLLRSAVALVGWSLLALVVPALRGRQRLVAAAVGLVFHVLAVSLVSVDWVLSLDPGFTSTDFAAGIAIAQLVAALAWGALLAPASSGGRQTTDIAGLMLATLLGVIYLVFMQYVVDWYGDLPKDVAWYDSRVSGIWRWLTLAALVGGGLIPALALMFASVRSSARALRWVALAVLPGIFLHVVWLVGPQFGVASLPAGALATIAIGGILIALSSGPLLAWKPLHGF